MCHITAYRWALLALVITNCLLLQGTQARTRYSVRSAVVHNRNPSSRLKGREITTAEPTTLKREDEDYDDEDDEVRGSNGADRGVTDPLPGLVKFNVTKTTLAPPQPTAFAFDNDVKITEQQVYYRATLHFTQVPFTNELAQKDSERFGQLQEDIITSLEDLYFNIPGDQFVTVVQFKSAEPGILVTFDIGAFADTTEKSVKEVLLKAVDAGQIGKFQVAKTHFSFRTVAAIGSPEELQACAENEFQCRDGSCVHERRKCDGSPHCPDGSDETHEWAQCNMDPVVLSMSDNQRIDAGGNVEFSAEIDHIGTAAVVWVKSPSKVLAIRGAVVVSDSRISAHHEEDSNIYTLRIRDLLPRDSGTYEVWVDLKKKKIVRSVQLTVVSHEADEDLEDPNRILPYFPTTTETQIVDQSLDRNPPINQCPDGHYQCKSRHCLPDNRKCDSYRDCPDGDDEDDCAGDSGSRSVSSECSQDEFRCSNGDCVDVDMRCDTRPDCRDGSDESGCGGEAPQSCGSSEWRCTIRHQCIELNQHCDGNQDCSDGSDESGCPTQPPTPSSPAIKFCRDGTQPGYSKHGTLYCWNTPMCPEHYECEEGMCCYKNGNRVGCSSQQFSCSDGQCIEESKRCDRKYDCTDGSDEMDCEVAIPPHQCASHEFKCSGGQCIDSRRKCDRQYDCPDGSDERECPEVEEPVERPTCDRSEFLCVQDSRCIPLADRCNREYDCADGSDEADCPEPEAPVEKVCSRAEFRCVQDGRCIPWTDQCNRVYDCADGSDEVNCEDRPDREPIVECAASEFQCANKQQCIAQSQRCDRQYHCQDGSDETDCSSATEAPVEVRCRSNEFQCGDRRSCVDRSVRCNRQYDCSDGSDEMDCDSNVCESGEFKCSSGQCVAGQKKCDRQPDCADGSDEHSCEQNQVEPRREQCRSDEFQCRSGQCVGAEKRCDRNYDCPDYSDEDSCNAGGDDACEPGYFECRNRQCIPETLKCNGRPDCQDSSDESDCRNPLVEQRGGCQIDEKTCANGECVKTEYVCDGEYDCRDRSDELNCPAPKPCEPNEFLCDNKRCVQKMWLCDGDDDCGDNSDEKNCDRREPGAQCRQTEFGCRSGGQCIPASFHCDSQNDCQDGSDEIGCAKPTVVEPPQDSLIVQRGEIIILKCRAVGVPVPTISWRKNWDHVCPEPRCTQTSVNGAGVLTIRNAVTDDSGAYTCEALNTGGRILAIPDCIVQVIDKGRCNLAGSLSSQPDASGRCRCKLYTTGQLCDQCQANAFWLSEKNPHGCNRCFCSGVTRDCDSSSWYRLQENLSFSNSLEGVAITDFREQQTDSNERNFELDRSGFVKYDIRNAPAGVAFWKLPASMRGDKITSYGGQLKFKFDYTGSGSPNNEPLVAISGNQITLVHRPRQEFRADSVQTYTLNIYENEFQREDGQEATREHLLMALAEIDSFLIKATFVSNQQSARLGEVTLDIAVDRDTQQERAWAVEQCRCPEGYIGLSCQECAPGWERSGGGLYLGTCVLAARDDCDKVGTQVVRPDGSCQCKAWVTGVRCDQCASDCFWLSAINPQGCIRCFCSGVTKQCESSNLNRQTERLDPAGVRVRTKDSVGEFRPRGTPRAQGYSVSFDSFGEGQGRVLYFELPAPFLGDKVTAYGGALSYKIRFSGSGRENPQPDVLIKGNDIILLHTTPQLRDDTDNDVKVQFYENEWRREDGQPATREHLIMTLADLDTLLIRISLRENMRSVSLSDVTLDVAVDRQTGLDRAWAVEQCQCPEGYKGTSCQDCSSGYVRTGGGLYLGLCEKCNCHGHADQCDAELGYCLDCKHNTEGDRCERCLEGYEGDATRGTPYDCRTSAVPITRDCSSQCHQHSTQCDERQCYNCRDNTDGERCDRCAYGYEGDARRGSPYDCQPIREEHDCRPQCHQHSDECQPEGDCYNCQDFTAGSNCEQCQPGYYGDARRGTPRDCQQCPCPDGLPCHADQYGQPVCKCPIGYTGNRCEHCAPGYSFDRETGRICRPIGEDIEVEIIPPADQTANEGDTVEFRCRIKGPSRGSNVAYNLAWTMDGTARLPSNAREIAGVLTIERINRNDEGRYVCTGSTPRKTATAYASLRVIPKPVVRPPIPSVTPQFQTIKVGEPAEFRCTATGEPTPVIEWGFQNPGGPLRPGLVQSRGLLIIPKATLRDEGGYYCTASNVGGTNSVQVNLFVQKLTRAPVVSIEPAKFNEVPRGQPFTLTARAEGLPEPKMVWRRRDGRELNAEDRGNGVLYFANIRDVNAGEYEVTATNSAGSASDVATIVPTGIYVFIVPKLTGREVVTLPGAIPAGTSVELLCVTEGTPKPRIEWAWDIGPARGDKPEGYVPPRWLGSSVFLDKFNPEYHKGKYTCSADNGVEQAGASLDVGTGAGGTAGGSREVYIIGGPTKVVSDAQTVEFECRARPDRTIEWSFNGGEIPSEIQHSLRQNNRILSLFNFNRNYAGVYRCEAFDADRRQIGTDEISLEREGGGSSVDVFVEGPSIRLVKEGDDLELKCTAPASSRISWYVINDAGARLTPRGEVVGGTLVIERVTQTDGGHYKCVTTERGREVGETTVTVVVSSSSTTPTEQEFLVGTDVELKCPIHHVSGLNIVWSRRDGGALPPNTKQINGILRIPDFKLEYAGAYECKVQVGAHVAFGYIQVRVEESDVLYLRIHSSGGAVAMGDEVSFACVVVGDPSARIEWRKLEGSLPDTTRIVGGSITFKVKTNEDAGVYRCTAYARAGTVLSSDAVLQVGNIPLRPFAPPDTVVTQIIPDETTEEEETEEIPPESAVRQTSQTVISTLGSTETIACPAEVAGGGGQISWRRLNKNLPVGSKKQEGNLIIPKLTKDDEGVYICTVSLDQGRNVVELYVDVIVADFIPRFKRQDIIQLRSSAQLSGNDMDLSVSFKPEYAEDSDKSDDLGGLLIHIPQQSKDYGISFGVTDGKATLEVSVNGKPTAIQLPEQLDADEWHTAHIRKRGNTYTLDVEGVEKIVQEIPGNLRLGNAVFLGGSQLDLEEEETSFTQKFFGCLSRLVLNKKAIALPHMETIERCSVCSLSGCANEGQCLPAHLPLGFQCRCGNSFTGQFCERRQDRCSSGQSCGTGSSCIDTAEGSSFCLCAMNTTGVNCETDAIVEENPLFDGEHSFIELERPPVYAFHFDVKMRVKPEKLSDSVLLYLADTYAGIGARDRLMLSIKDKKFQLKVNTGSGALEVKSDQVLKPNEWYTVGVGKNLSEAKLTVTYGKTSVNSGEIPGNNLELNVNTNLFVGGINYFTRVQNGNAQYRSFKGCIASPISINGKQIDLIRDAVNSGNIGSCTGPIGGLLVNPCDDKPCAKGQICQDKGDGEHLCTCPKGKRGKNCEITDVGCEPNPCKNGGICKVVDATVKCLCEPGFVGPNCEDLDQLTDTAYFEKGGDAWLELPRDLLPHLSSEDEEVIEMTIRTTQFDGLIIWHGQTPDSVSSDQDYLSVGLTDGFLEFNYELGGGPAQIVSSQRVNTNELHRVLLKRTGQNGIMVIDDRKEEVGQSGGILAMLNTEGNIYIGGVPNFEQMTSEKFNNGFEGCLIDLTLNGRKINYLTDKVHSGGGTITSKCPDKEDVDTYF